MTSLFTGLNSIYNAGQFTLKKRFAKNFSVQAAYTYSRAIDYISKNAQVTSLNIQNPFNWRMAESCRRFRLRKTKLQRCFSFSFSFSV